MSSWVPIFRNLFIILETWTSVYIFILTQPATHTSIHCVFLVVIFIQTVLFGFNANLLANFIAWVSLSLFFLTVIHCTLENTCHDAVGLCAIPSGKLKSFSCAGSWVRGLSYPKGQHSLGAYTSETKYTLWSCFHSWHTSWLRRSRRGHGRKIASTKWTMFDSQDSDIADLRALSIFGL